MSAFIVGKEHIDYLVQAARNTDTRFRHDGKYLDARVTEDADTIGRLLWQENVNSVAYRYQNHATPGTLSGLPGPNDFDHESIIQYTCPIFGLAFNPVAVLKAIQCYDYQSCEHPGWKASESALFCEWLAGTCIGRLPGYDDAPWDIGPDSRIAPNPAYPNRANPDLAA